MSKKRETAWRVFSPELNTATYTIEAAEQMMPSYQLSRLGAPLNRVLIAGGLTEKENIGSEEDPMWRGRIQDVKNGFVYINVGRYQPEAQAEIVDIDPPSLVAVMGKVKAYTPEDGKTFVSVRPETIITIDEDTFKEWLLDASKSTWHRMLNIRRAVASADRTPEGLLKAGINKEETEGVSEALQRYEPQNSESFLYAIQDALRTILPDKNVDLGLPEEMDDLGSPDEIGIDAGESDSEEAETAVLALLDELDQGGKGAPRDELEARAEDEGISSMELEEITNSLMDKGLIYEPNLRYLKKI